MGVELKRISQAALPAALAKAERYRLLNEPEQAESICRDVLAVEPIASMPPDQLVQWLGPTIQRYLSG